MNSVCLCLHILFIFQVHFPSVLLLLEMFPPGPTGPINLFFATDPSACLVYTGGAVCAHRPVDLSHREQFTLFISLHCAADDSVGGDHVGTWVQLRLV